MRRNRGTRAYRARRDTATSPLPRRRQRIFPLAGLRTYRLVPTCQTSQACGALSVVGGVRTCLPLRGSSGVTPDSLFILPLGKNQWNEPTIAWPVHRDKPIPCGFVVRQSFARRQGIACRQHSTRVLPALAISFLRSGALADSRRVISRSGDPQAWARSDACR